MDSSLFFFFMDARPITDGRRHGDGNGTGGRRVCTDRRDEESQQRRNGRTGTDSHGWIVAAVAERVLLIRQHTLFKTKTLSSNHRKLENVNYYYYYYYYYYFHFHFIAFQYSYYTIDFDKDIRLTDDIVSIGRPSTPPLTNNLWVDLCHF
jgi:hypothetical protein